MSKTHSILDGTDDEVLKYYLGDLYTSSLVETKSSETKKILNITEYMKLLKQFLDNNKLYVSLIKKICECPDIDECDCDDDMYTLVHKTTFDIQTKHNLAVSFKESIKLTKPGFNIRLFAYDKMDNEISIMNINHEINKLTLVYDDQELEYNCNIVEDSHNIKLVF